jgi:hypothetical protein
VERDAADAPAGQDGLADDRSVGQAHFDPAEPAVLGQFEGRADCPILIREVA